MKHMVVMNFDDPRGVDTIEPEKDVLELLDDDQKHRLTKARSSAFFVAKFVDIVPQDELEEREKEKRDKDLVSRFCLITRIKLLLEVLFGLL